MRISDWSSDVCSSDLKTMHDHWRLFLAEGIILALLGLGAVIVPPLAGLVSTIFLGWLFLIAGIFGVLFTLRGRQAPGVLWSALSAVLALVAGGLLLWNPLQGLVTLTYVLTAFFIADGRSEEHTSELQSLMRISYAVFCLHKKKTVSK